MLRVRCLRGGSRGAEAAHLIGAMVGNTVVSSFHLSLFFLLFYFFSFFFFFEMAKALNGIGGTAHANEQENKDA